MALFESMLALALRRDGAISDDAFHRLEAELDWAELNAAPRERLELEEA